MKIRIIENARDVYRAKERNNPEWEKQMEAIQGTLVEVETDFMFADHYNTAPIEGVSTIGMRIMDAYVAEVIDDARDGVMKCSYCGCCQDINYYCEECGRCENVSGLNTKSKVSLDYCKRAFAERDHGGSCNVNYRLPTVALKMSDESEYFFQGEEAENLIEEYEKIEWLVVNFEDYLLAVAQNW